MPFKFSTPPFDNDDRALEALREDGGLAARLGIIDEMPIASFFYANGVRCLSAIAQEDSGLPAITIFDLAGNETHTIVLNPNGGMAILSGPNSK